MDDLRQSKIKLCVEVRTELWKLRDKLADLRKTGREGRDAPYYLRNSCTDDQLLTGMKRDTVEIAQLRDLIKREESSSRDLSEFQKLHTQIFGEPYETSE